MRPAAEWIALKFHCTVWLQPLQARSRWRRHSTPLIGDPVRGGMMAISGAVRFESFEPGHLDGCVACARALGWPSYADPSTALAAFSAPGSVTWVALHDGEVVGLAHLLTNGVVHSHLSLVGVLPGYRRGGIAHRLVTEVFQQSGAKWLDLWSDPEAEDFYRSFTHQERVGFRIYPRKPAA